MKLIKKGRRDKMNIDVKDKITLNNDKEYVVVSKINYQNKIYYYLIEANNQSSFKICYEKTGTNILVDSEDKDINTALVPLFAEQLKPFSNIEIPDNH